MEQLMVTPLRPVELIIGKTVPFAIIGIFQLILVTTVALLHFFYIWNETRYTSLYLGIAPNLQTISFGIQRSQSFFFTPEALMVGALVVMVIPVIVLVISQRFFMQDMIVTQIEK